MLTFEQLQAELARITYKQGWAFHLYPHRFEGIWLSILIEVPDANWPTRTTTINVRTAVPPIPNATYLYEWLAYRIGRIESHEMREFLRVDNARIYDPHAPGANE